MRADAKRLTVRPRFTVLAGGAIENARLLLAANDVMKSGIGNQNDQVGRFFADHPIPREVATLVLFDGRFPRTYFSGQGVNNAFPLPDGTPVRAVFAPTSDYIRSAKTIGSLTTVDRPVPMTEAMGEAVAATAQMLGVNASKARPYALGCGIEPTPDPDRRVTLTGERDALGTPRVKLHVTLPDRDFDRYRLTLRELVLQIIRHGTFNFLLSNGQALWAHASTNLHYLVRQHPFSEVHLRDEDVKVDLAELNGPQDRLAIVVTEPLTTNETWTRIAPGEMVTFLDGSPLAAACGRPLALAG